MALNRTIVVVTRFANGAYTATNLYASDFDNEHQPITTVYGPNTTPAELFLPEGSELPTGGFTKVYKIRAGS